MTSIMRRYFRFENHQQGKLGKKQKKSFFTSLSSYLFYLGFHYLKSVSGPPPPPQGRWAPKKGRN
jgi:hypothetical protein